jgi:hypothetical protein
MLDNLLTICYHSYIIKNDKGKSMNYSFVARIPKEISGFIRYVSETKKWTITTVLTELAKSSPLYKEYLALKK